MNSRRSTQFCPGLAAFTDAIEALPQETIRHFTLLREVDAKASGPEDLLRNYIKHSLNIQTSATPVVLDPNTKQLQPLDNGAYRPFLGTPNQANELNTNPIVDNASDEHTKRSHLHQVRILISDLLLTLDEKIHVISTASEALAKHQVRIDDAYKTTAHEIDPIIRDGNPAHWAYGNSIIERSGSQKQGGSDGLPLQAMPSGAYTIEAEPGGTGPSSRGESRREGMSRRQNNLPETLEPKTTSHPDTSILLYEGSSNIPAAKRRKGATHNGQQAKALAPERISGPVRSGAYSTPQIPHVALAQPPKAHGLQSLPPTPGNTKLSNPKKRATAHPTAAVLSSPSKQNFPEPRVHVSTSVSGNPVMTGPEHGKRDALHRNPRSKGQSARAEMTKPIPKADSHVKQEDKGSPFEPREIPNNKILQDRLPQTSLERTTNSEQESNYPHGKPSDATQTSNSVLNGGIQNDGSLASHDMPSNAIESSSKVADSIEKPGMRGAVSSSSKPPSKSTLPSDISTLKTMSGKLSKASKGSPSQKIEGTNVIPDDIQPINEEEREEGGEEEEAEGDPDEMRYCYCNQVSYGKMVACDGPGCQREWFHLPCVGLTHMPSSKDKWYCRECRSAIQSGSKSNKAGQQKT